MVVGMGTGSDLDSSCDIFFHCAYAGGTCGIQMSEEIHVIPTQDIKPHIETIFCWCRPIRDADNSNVVIHNAFAAEYGEERDIA